MHVVLNNQSLLGVTYILKKLNMLYLMFISSHMVLKEKFGHVVPNNQSLLGVMYILKNLDMLYLIFISAHMVLK